jgi:hypothetical protein
VSGYFVYTILALSLSKEEEESSVVTQKQKLPLGYSLLEPTIALASPVLVLPVRRRCAELSGSAPEYSSLTAANQQCKNKQGAD